MPEARSPKPVSSIGTVAIIGGTGRLGLGMAKRLASKGIHVVIGSRDPAKAQAAAASVGAPARGLVNVDAAKAGDVIILAVPYAAHRATLETLAPAAAGKVVVDTAVPLGKDGGVRIERSPAGSLAQEAAAMLPGATVAAAFHTASAGMLQDLARTPHGDVLICTDDPAARAVVEDLARAVGMRPVDSGGLGQSHALEQIAGLLLTVNRRYKRRDLGITIAGLD